MRPRRAEARGPPGTWGDARCGPQRPARAWVTPGIARGIVILLASSAQVLEETEAGPGPRTGPVSSRGGSGGFEWVLGLRDTLPHRWCNLRRRTPENLLTLTSGRACGSGGLQGSGPFF